jgi:hypothetical protein
VALSWFIHIDRLVVALQGARYITLQMRTLLIYGSLAVALFLAVVVVPGNLVLNQCMGAAMLVLIGALVTRPSLWAAIGAVFSATTLIFAVGGYIIGMAEFGFLESSMRILGSLASGWWRFVVPLVATALAHAAVTRYVPRSSRGA